MEVNQQDKLLVLWTSPDREVALKMAFMYTKNSKLKGWWDEVKLLVWGPSAKLLAEDQELQAYVKVMMDTGIEVFACKACSDRYGVSDILEGLGVNVFFVGERFTELLKSDWKVLSL